MFNKKFQMVEKGNRKDFFFYCAGVEYIPRTVIKISGS